MFKSKMQRSQSLLKNVSQLGCY